ncbi:MAG TPA: tetratricopeptide repeat protein, partial [Bacteroidia bacterium]|nr:tetratricopeptide repeat protein [Bacteroidia bacterium]
MNFKYFITFLLLSIVLKSNADKIDSLKTALNTSKKDTTLLKNYYSIGREYYYNGNLDSSIHYFKIGLENAIKQDDPKFICTFYSELGLTHREKGIYDVAYEYMVKSLNVADDNNFEVKKANCYNGMAVIHAVQKEFDKAIEYYNKAMIIYMKKGELRGQASINNNVGLIYLEKKDYNHALDLFHKARGLNDKCGNDYGLAANLENIGLIYDGEHKYDSAKVYLYKAYDIWKQRNDTHSLAINMSYIGNSLLQQGKYNEAIQILTQALVFSKRVDAKTTSRDLLYYLSGTYEKTGDFKNSLRYYKLAKQLGDSLLNDSKRQEITEMQLGYSFNKIKMQDSIRYQMEVKNKENQLINEKKNTSITLVALFIIAILLFFSYKGYRDKKKSNTIITQQKILVEQKQKEILDSINYAKKIQSALLANKEFINEHIEHNFIFHKSKDIVSGDFYWATRKNDFFYLAVCDSTGHGVPGAFMSLLNIGFINEAINEKNILEPDAIFNFVRDKLIYSIGKDGQKDGFDGILLRINLKDRSMVYAAAHNRPVIIENNTITELECDRMPV